MNICFSLRAGDAMLLRNIFEQIIRTNRQELEDDELDLIKKVQAHIDSAIAHRDKVVLADAGYSSLPGAAEDERTSMADYARRSK